MNVNVVFPTVNWSQTKLKECVGAIKYLPVGIVITPIFVVLQQHYNESQYFFDVELANYCAGLGYSIPTIVSVLTPLNDAESCLLASKLINNLNPALLVMRELQHKTVIAINSVITDHLDGLIGAEPALLSDHCMVLFKNGLVKSVRIDNDYSCSGVFLWASGRDFVTYATALKISAAGLNNVGDVVDLAISHGGRFGVLCL